jgi:hypothetical protein
VHTDLELDQPIAWTLAGNTDRLTLREFVETATVHLPPTLWIDLGLGLATRGRFEHPELGIVALDSGGPTTA